MVPLRNSCFALSIVTTVGVSVIITWMAWKYVKRKYLQTRPLYVAKKICIVNSPEEWEALHMQLRKDKILGLDCEWVSKQKVALLQLASPSGLCVLVRLFKIKSNFPESLKCLLADNSILKVGVAIVDDSRRLHQDYGLIVRGCVDLRHVLKRTRGRFDSATRGLRGLRGLANGILGVDISKNSSVRCGNWEAEIYTKQQMEYAATDAAVAVDIFLSLIFSKIGKHTNIHQTVKSNGNNSFSSEYSDIPSSLATIKKQQTLNNLTNVAVEEWEASTSMHLLYPDITNYERGDNAHGTEEDYVEDNVNDATQDKNETFPANDISITGISSSSGYFHFIKNFDGSRDFPSRIFDELQDDKKKEVYAFVRSICQGIVDSGYTHDAGNVHPAYRSGLQPKQQEKTKNNAYSFRKRPLWDNCRLQAPDGTVLCTCDQRKAKWYLDKELGDMVCEDPLTVRLRFEPSNRPESERNYYLHEKKNICVVCGHDKDYIRKFVVPLEYRKYFPAALKDHSSHDILLLCSHCHRKSCDSDIVMRLQLAEECDAPLDSGLHSRICMDHELQKVRSAGRALMNKNQIPKERVVELEKILKDFFGIDATEDLVRRAADINAKQTANSYVSHGEKVVKHVTSNGELLTFQMRWRQHFLDTMNPQHLPAFWSVDFVPEAWSLMQQM